MGQAAHAGGGHFGRFTRLLSAAALLIAAGAGLQALWRAREDRRFLATGPAQWIWYTRQIEEPVPLRFRAMRSFRLEGPPPARVPVRLFGDRQWSLEVNGKPAASGEQAPGSALVVLDLAGRLRPGENRIALEVSAPQGVGGVLFWMDLGREGVLVSDEAWQVEKLPAGTKPRRHAAVWGKPPMHPWGYPRLPGP